MTRLLFGTALLLAISLSAPHSAEGRARTGARVQLLDFSGGLSPRGAAIDLAGNGPTRARLVDDFARLGQDNGLFAATPFAPRASIDFAMSGRGDTEFVRSPAILVPDWMRGRNMTWSDARISTDIPAIGSCGGSPYAASRLLRVRAEDRRRLLYPLVVQAACRYGIPVGLFDAMIIQESGYRPFIRSPKGALGLGQLLPGTAAQLGVDPYNVYGNLDGSARYLAAHLREFGQPQLALAAYNAGPGRVRKAWRIPRIAETQTYVRSILWNWQKLEWQAAR